MSIGRTDVGRAIARVAVCLTAVNVGARAADEPTLQQAATEYAAMARPLLERYCLACHSTEAMEGELDLERFATLDDVRRDTAVWLKVGEMLDNGEMPPKEGRRMPDERRAALRGWLADYLKAEALASAGDPGPVVLRRLSNAQYTYTLRDLTGVALDPAREFPVDGAAGEGFTNTGNALVMSPALLTKYLDAAKEVASHAVPLSDGMRFSTGTTRRDWADEALERIRAFYAEFTDAGGGSEVNLQGIVFGTNTGGLLPVARYLEATLAEREALRDGTKTIDSVARERGLSSKYLGRLWPTLNAPDGSPLLDPIRARWRVAKPSEAAGIAAEIARWQVVLWKFNSVGHVGKVGGPKSWMEAVSPLLTRQEFRVAIPEAPDGGMVALYLSADPAGDGDADDEVVWERPRLVAPGMPDLPLRDVPRVARALAALRERVFQGTARSLAAAAEASASAGQIDRAALAHRHEVPVDVLAAWFYWLGLCSGDGSVTITTLLQGKAERVGGYDFANGWGPASTPNMVANSSNMHVRVPGNLNPHSVAMHPSPILRVGTGWRSPVAGVLEVTGKVQHAHPECGNGVTWSLEVRRGATRQRLAAGVSQGANVVPFGPIKELRVRPGDFVTLWTGPRDGNYACDLTAVDMTLSGEGRSWDLAGDVSPDVLAGNPHADRLGNAAVWHFYTEPVSDGDGGAVIPQGSLLARWQSATTREEQAKLANELQAFLTSGGPAAKDSADGQLFRQLASLRGPLFGGARAELLSMGGETPAALGAARFGRLPGGQAVDEMSLGARAPSVIEVALPADLVAGCTFVTAGALPPGGGPEGSVQLGVALARPAGASGVDPARPVVVGEQGRARQRFEAAFEEFRQLFPPALCYTKIVPVDEVVTLTLHHREDDHLRRLMLDDVQAARLDRMWDELRFVSQDALALVDVLEQLLEYASQDADPSVFQPMRKPIEESAERFRQQLLDADPKQVDAVITFASKAYRRPLSDDEAGELRALYRRLREEELHHDDAWRLLLARVLVAPDFLYRVETAAPGAAPAALNDWQLASRLSYFLWSSAPDERLRELATGGTLHNPDALAAEARRMLGDPKTRRLATEFGCQWLHVYDFDTQDEKSERHFPTFAGLRGAMYEEAIRFLTELFQRDLPVLAFLDADFTVLNEPLAKHYGIAGVSGEEWRRVEGVREHGRGGILGLAAPLAQQSGASRTSPILRGTWVSEVLLGEKLPKPPPGVPQLPDDEAATGGLSVRELVERHSRDPKCAMCHAKVDPFGFALEAYDAIGRRRDRDLGDHAIRTEATLQDGTTFEGLDGLRDYLLVQRREAVSRQFSRKLLGYALGRAVQLSDTPLLDELTKIVADGGRFSAVVEAIVRSPQFREIRGRDTVVAEGP
jgi:mono/diheme cytochrome c family protein